MMISSKQAAPQDTLTAISASLLKPSFGLSVLTITAVFLCVAAGVAWSAMSEVIEVAVGDGRVIPSSKLQVVQNLEGGIVKSLAVHEGDRVRKGQLLLQMDPTGAGATLGELREQLISLEARSVWLKALLANIEPKYDPAFMQAHAEIVQSNIEEFNAKKAEQLASITSAHEQAKQRNYESDEAAAELKSVNASLGVAQAQLDMIVGLSSRGAAPRGEILAAKARVLELQGQAQKLKSAVPRLTAASAEAEARSNELAQKFKGDIASILNETNTKIESMRNIARQDEDKLRRADVLAPVDGVIKTLNANTIGQVLKPGENILEIVPSETELIVQAKVKPQDVAFLQKDQRAIIKLSAYDYAIYGSLEGKVSRISADSTVDERGNAYFLVDVKSEKPYLESHGKKNPIIPGMMAQVDIVTGSKTVLSYLTKPMHRMASESLQER